MKKLLIGTAFTAIVIAGFSCSRKMETKMANNKKSAADAGKNKTEGYFYHHSEENLNSDSTKIKKNVNN